MSLSVIICVLTMHLIQTDKPKWWSRMSGMTNNAMNTFPSNDNLDLPELKENPHWRAQTSGTSGMTRTQWTHSQCNENPHRRAQTSGMSRMTNDVTNTFPMWQTYSWCNEHVPDMMRTHTGGHEPPEQAGQQMHSTMTQWFSGLLELEENPHIRAQTS